MTAIFERERGYYADWIDTKGVPRLSLRSAAIHGDLCGHGAADRARRVVEAVIARRHELGPAWENCWSIQTISTTRGILVYEAHV